jgi:hypothetical protein
LSAPLHTVTTSLDCTVSWRLCWFCNIQGDLSIMDCLSARHSHHRAYQNATISF